MRLLLYGLRLYCQSDHHTMVVALLISYVELTKKMKILIGMLVCLALAGVSKAQEKPAKIVFDINSRDTLTHQTVLRHVTPMSNSYPDSKFEVVVYGGALSTLLKDKSSVAKGVSDLSEKGNVTFKACAVTMKRHDIAKSQLLPGVDVVPDATIEIVGKQQEGWGYIKE